MKAISVWEPWAWCIIYGGKRVENRGWSWRGLSYRGPLLIHASRRWDYLEYRLLAGRIKRRFGITVPSADAILDRGLGGIIGMVDLISVTTCSSSPWFEGPVGLVLVNPRPLPFVPFPGRLGLFEVPDELIKGA